MSDNFVDVIGFQFEKVHTGVISWLLDSENATVPSSDRALLIRRLQPKWKPISKTTTIKPIQEYSFGRSRRIDLVVQVGERRYLVFECKTDSDVDVQQLEQTRDAFLAKNPEVECSFFVLAIGASQFTYQHRAEEIKELGFVVLDISPIRRIFSGLTIQGKQNIYDEWCEALETEAECVATIDRVLAEMESPWDERLRRRGYRIGFPVFYNFYGKLREHLEKGLYRNWAIYSGRNNPVLNWLDSWLNKQFGNEVIKLYFEFNWNSLRLKAELQDRSSEAWGRLRDEVQQICSISRVRGKRTQNRRGTWVSAYKWDFDFCRESVLDIATKTNTILYDIYEKLRDI